MHTPAALVRSSKPYMSGVWATGHVSLWLFEGKWFCTISSASHTIFRSTTTGQCRLWVSSDDFSPWSSSIWHIPLVLHDLHLIHTDLKPENILLVHNQYTTVPVAVPGKVCAFELSKLQKLRYSSAQRATSQQAYIVLHRYPSHRFWVGHFPRRVSLNRCMHATLPRTRNHLRYVSSILPSTTLQSLNSNHHRPWLVISMWCVLSGMYSRRVLHRRRALPNTRQLGASSHDGDGHGQDAWTFCTRWPSRETWIFQRWL